MAVFAVSELQWAGNKANHKRERGFSLCHPTRRAEGDNMEKLRDRRRGSPPVTLTSDDTPEKRVLLTIFSHLFSLLCLGVLYQNVFENDSWSRAPLKAFH